MLWCGGKAVPWKAVPIGVIIVPVLVELPANGPGEVAEDGTKPWILAPM